MAVTIGLFAAFLTLYAAQIETGLRLWIKPPLKGEIFVFGKMKSLQPEEAKQRVLHLGGHVSDRVDKSTSQVVADDPTDSQRLAALEYREKYGRVQTQNSAQFLNDMEDRAKPETLIERGYDTLDTKIYDGLYALRGPHLVKQAQNNEVAIVMIDPESEARINDGSADPDMLRWKGSRSPFPRSLIAALIRKLNEAGATVIGLDQAFTTTTDSGEDQALKQALKECGNVVLAARFNTKNENLSSNQDFPFPFLDEARAAAPANLPPDNLDGSIRRFQLTMPHPDFFDPPFRRRDFPTFATLVAALYWNNQQKDRPEFRTIPENLFETQLLSSFLNDRFGDRKLYFHREDQQSQGEISQESYLDPTPMETHILHDLKKRGEDGSMLICYTNTAGSSSNAYQLSSLWDKSSAPQLKKWFSNKIVLVGSFIPEEQDSKPTPLTNDRRYGVEIQANVIHTLLSGHLYHAFPENNRVLLVWMCALLTAVLTLRLRPVLALLAILVMLAAVFVTIWLAFRNYQYLAPTQVLTATAASFLFETVYFYAVEERRANRARSHFSRYVGPQVMSKVLDTDFQFGSVEKRYVTILFSDVQGFTSLVEKMDPVAAVELLNKYLDEMVDIIYQYDGTLDKIMGDGIMAYFGAPDIVPKHEQKAVLCGLAMQKAMKAWRKVSEAQGLPPLKIRIGIHSGEVVVGEVGAKKQVGYTVIGDAVNTAARLEPLNKEFGTEILISEAVRDHLDDSVETEYVGELAIRGRKEGIRAYSVPDRDSDSPGKNETGAGLDRSGDGVHL